jgi:hypothetical protein
MMFFIFNTLNVVCAGCLWAHCLGKGRLQGPEGKGVQKPNIKKQDKTDCLDRRVRNKLHCVYCEDGGWENRQALIPTSGGHRFKRTQLMAGEAGE